MTYQETIDYSSPHMNMVGAFYKFGKGDTDFDKGTKIVAILAAPVGQQDKVFNEWLLKGNNNKLAIPTDINLDDDVFDAYIHFTDGTPFVYGNKPLKDYLEEGGFI